MNVSLNEASFSIHSFTSPHCYSDCIGSRDPHCVWNTTGLQCKESALSASEDLTGTVPSV